MSDRYRKTSKFLSLVLRHQPESIGLVLDEHGYAEVDELLAKLAGSGHSVTRKFLEEVVEHNDKKRFAFDESGEKIRASQGHSIKIDLDLKALNPPPTLFHGTATRFLESILREGLTPQSRQHVHLSTDRDTMIAVARRHGKPAILVVDASAMHREGFTFFQSANGVWLTERVPPKFFEVEN